MHERKLVANQGGLPKGHLSVSNATALKIQKSLVVWKTICANLERTDLMSVRLLGFAPQDATTAPLFSHFFNLRRDRYDALQEVSSMSSKDHDLQRLVTGMAIDISLWHEFGYPVGKGHSMLLTRGRQWVRRGLDYEMKHDANFVYSHVPGIPKAMAALPRLKSVEITTNGQRHPNPQGHVVTVDPFEGHDRSSILLESAPETFFLNFVDALSFLKQPLETLYLRTGHYTPLSLRIFINK